MNWYVAHIILECWNQSTAQALGSVEEQVRVLTAEDAEDAYRKALQLGRSAEHEYDNSEGLRIRWSFRGLADLDELPQPRIEDGSEITSRIIQDAEGARRVKSKGELTLFLTNTVGKMKVKDIPGVEDESTH